MVEGAVLYHDCRLVRREKEVCIDGQGLEVVDPGVVAGVDAVSRLTLLPLDWCTDDATLDLSSSSLSFEKRCTVILGSFCS